MMAANQQFSVVAYGYIQAHLDHASERRLEMLQAASIDTAMRAATAPVQPQPTESLDSKVVRGLTWLALQISPGPDGAHPVILRDEESVVRGS